MWSVIIERYKLEATVEQLLATQMHHKKELFKNSQLIAIEGIPQLIEQLKDSGIKLGLASSSSREFIEMILKSLNIIDKFDVILSGEEVKKGKPAPDVFLKTADLLGVNPCDCIVLEDSEHGITAAKAAGMKCIAYENPNSGNQDLSLADAVVKTLVKIDYNIT